MSECENCGYRYPSIRAALLCCDEKYKGERYPERGKHG